MTSNASTTGPEARDLRDQGSVCVGDHQRERQQDLPLGPAEASTLVSNAARGRHDRPRDAGPPAQIGLPSRISSSIRSRLR